MEGLRAVAPGAAPTVSTLPAGSAISLAALSIGCPAAAVGQVGTPYNSALEATGGTPPYTFSIVGLLPNGLTLDPTTGAITGTPTTSGVAEFEAVTTDATAGVASSICLISIVPATSFIITASAGPGGTIDPNGAVSVDAGGSQTFTISPDACYEIADVLVDGVSVGRVASYAFANVQANHTIAASFALKTYAIAASAAGGGTISPAGNVSVSCGGNQSFTITPAACYDIADVVVDHVSVGPATTYTFANVQANHAIAATFRIKTFTIAASAGAGGSISPPGGVGLTCGGNQTFTITPNVCYEIADVRVDNVSVGAVSSYAFSNVQASHTIEASFALKSYVIDASAGAGGTIAPAGNVNVGCGASQSFAITADPGFAIADVLVDGASVGAVESYAFTNVVANHSISASFASVVVNGPPDCSGATSTPSLMWSPNHDLVPISIAGVTDPDGDPVTITVTGVTQDEPLVGHDDDLVSLAGILQGNTCPDAVIDPQGGLRLRAERVGQGNGRVYVVSFTASDGRGGSSTCKVQVCVPHDADHLVCVDDRQDFSSLGPCPEGGDVDQANAATAIGLRAMPIRGDLATIEYSLPVAGEVRIALYDVFGRRVAALGGSRQEAGSHRLTWSTSGLPRGLYYCRLNVGQATVTKTILVLRR
jgi:hypothetical protein